ncbi:MAG: amino acid permease [Alphaproteobacteria bacterium]|nr:amino acid permease [Alphaproteobacteria bacterium]
MSKKMMGFWSVFAIVFGSQIGSGIFMLPSILAPYGIFGVFGWCFAGIGAMLLALVFSELCSRFPQTGGPHIYVKEGFGIIPAFFIGWAYWLVSWISTAVVIVSAVAYLNPFLNNPSSNINLTLEIGLLAIITIINCKSVKLSGQIEFVLTLLKFIPFVIVPIILLQSFDSSCISLSEKFIEIPSPKLISIVTILCFWGFIGVECATTPAGSVRNPEKNIPRAIILGTLTVAIVYFINNVAIMGVVPEKILAESSAPFVDAINIVAGENVSYLLSAIASIVCIGTLNAWVLTSAQISLGLSQDKLLPLFFAKTNKENSPYISVLISSIGLIPILILTKQNNFAEQISYIINFSVIVFLAVYIACCLVYLKLMIQEKNILKIILGIISIVFCAFAILDSPIRAILDSSVFFLSGCLMLPFAPFRNKKK